VDEKQLSDLLVMAVALQGLLDVPLDRERKECVRVYRLALVK